ncbi:peptidoglycan/LPS O-acetylase OafA/YrhL [Nitrospirillum bahiense]|uniref:Peptidoglycan/LPS O-acetylase OafA/YrhL n=2 Tax=Nitrospirillum amazonense TaxID=28077 RepID=A0A560FXG5_9PROT|nr:peptidoglycan/LPS O-acetylase OafA/YrhL [Nitrospirillum amazonense]
MNGGIATYTFFVMSAFVLTQSYLETSYTAFERILQRATRLLAPAIASWLMALTLLTILPQSRAWVAPYVSPWARQRYADAMTGPVLAKDIALNSMLLGYEGVSLFDFAAAKTHLVVAHLSDSLNPPLWSLHAEFWGSLLVLLMARLYRILPSPWFWMIFTVTLLVTGTSHYTLFLLGVAGYLGRHRMLALHGAIPALMGMTLIAAAVFLGMRAASFPFDSWVVAARSVSLLQAPGGKWLQNEVAATLLMAGILIQPRIRHILAAPWLVWLGHRSFALYLVHFPLLFTVGFAIFSVLLDYLQQGTALFLTVVFGGGLSLAAATLFERWIDRPAIRLSRKALRPKPSTVPAETAAE